MNIWPIMNRYIATSTVMFHDTVLCCRFAHCIRGNNGIIGKTRNFFEMRRIVQTEKFILNSSQNNGTEEWRSVTAYHQN